MTGKVRWLFGSLFGLTTLLALIVFCYTRQSACLFIGGSFFALILGLDLLSGSDPSTIRADEEKHAEKDGFYFLALLLPVPIILALIFLSAWILASMKISVAGQIALLLTLALTAASALNIGHELCHRNSALAQWIGRLCCAIGAYGHFPIAHNYYHHVAVATPEDPSTARFGESFYRFLVRQIIGNWRHACRLEQQRLTGNQWWHNHIVQNGVMTLFIYSGIMMLAGVDKGLYAIGALIAGDYVFFALAEYIEHYGLSRAQDDSGNYEPCLPKHSWNANAIFSNLYLFNLERHSDHHAFPSRPYQILRHFDEAPQLPTGYLGMMFLALVPPLWFRIMHARLPNQPEAIRNRKLSHFA
jgi:alkane 1-monooxygenase